MKLSFIEQALNEVSWARRNRPARKDPAGVRRCEAQENFA
jgi:hypothetical protein